jgi:hypothetical protein
MGDDKRKHPRERKRAKVDMGKTPLFTTDLSAGGFCTESARVLDPGSEVAGTIAYHGATYAFSGRVQWAKAGDIRFGIRGRMGLRFTAVAPDLVAMVTK